MEEEEKFEDKGSEGLLEKLPRIPKDDDGFVVSFDIGLLVVVVVVVVVLVFSGVGGGCSLLFFFFFFFQNRGKG